MSSADLSRVIQGIVTGIGFIGGGVILKMSEQHQIVGITTAATIWLTASIGIATGTGHLGLAVVGTLLAYIILTFFGWLEREILGDQRPEG
jgi:putative Mg2+ transporter-C (MgtC) family protein